MNKMCQVPNFSQLLQLQPLLIYIGGQGVGFLECCSSLQCKAPNLLPYQTNISYLYHSYFLHFGS